MNGQVKAKEITPFQAAKLWQDILHSRDLGGSITLLQEWEHFPRSLPFPNGGTFEDTVLISDFLAEWSEAMAAWARELKRRDNEQEERAKAERRERKTRKSGQQKLEIPESDDDAEEEE